MNKHLTDIRIRAVEIYWLPVATRVPLSFGHEVLRQIQCLRVRVTVESRRGERGEGWGESPLSVGWGWPGTGSYAEREKILMSLCEDFARAFTGFAVTAHPLEIGTRFQAEILPALVESRGTATGKSIPQLAALISFAPFDLALHDAFGRLCGIPTYASYTAEHMNRDLAGYLEPAPATRVSFAGLYPASFLRPAPLRQLPVWHMVGGVDLLEASELTGREPQDGYPVLLRDWIREDGIKCLKFKLRGDDAEWDFQRVVAIGRIAIEEGCTWLTADFNCTAPDVAYVNAILDRVRDEQPRIYGMLLYIEQPFPHDLMENLHDVHSIAARKPLFLDESAHDWTMVRLGRELGWNGVALKTCKTQTGAILSGCWASAHGMSLMVQDLTNPMLAQISHAQLAAHFPTIMGLESNACQFYPDASRPEARVHPGLFRRRNGMLSLASVGGNGLGYRIEEIGRALPESSAAFASA